MLIHIYLRFKIVFKIKLAQKKVQRKTQYHAATNRSYQDRVQHGSLFQSVVSAVGLSIQY